MCSSLLTAWFMVPLGCYLHLFRFIYLPRFIFLSFFTSHQHLDFTKPGNMKASFCVMQTIICSFVLLPLLSLYIYL